MTILNPILRVAKIISDNAITYGGALINSTIYDSHLKAIPNLYCKRHEKTKELYLLEIRLCFSNNVQKLTLINCVVIVIKIRLDIK